MDPVLELENLKVRFGECEILKGLSVRLTGPAIGLLGPNGAGKTTLIHTLLGFHKPSAGRARVQGLDIDADLTAIRRITGYMPENESFIAGMSAVRFVALMAELSGIPQSAALERAHQALFFVGLGEARYRNLETYSLGMRQRVKLAQALVHGPQVVFLDEPTNGLDPPARRKMIALICEVSRHHSVRLILSSHLLKDVEDCCQEVLILKEGRIAACCNLDEERRTNRKFVELETRGEQNAFLAALDQLGCEWAQFGGSRVKLVLPQKIEIRNLFEVAARCQVQVRRLDYKRDSLQDIFLKAMEKPDGCL